MPADPVLCTAVVVCDPAGRVLLLRRAPERLFLAGLWHLPGGRICAGEAAPDCAVRELEEETGLRVHRRQLEYLGTTHHAGMEGIVFRAHRVEGEPFNVESHIHDRIGGFDPASPPEPLFEGTAEVLGWLRERRTR